MERKTIKNFERYEYSIGSKVYNKKTGRQMEPDIRGNYTLNDEYGEQRKLSMDSIKSDNPKPNRIDGRRKSMAFSGEFHALVFRLMAEHFLKRTQQAER